MVVLVLEAMCDHNLFFWHHQFGFAGSMNDINIWDLSSLHHVFVNGSWSQNIDFEFQIDGQTFNQLWVAVDGIYPEIARFVKTKSCPIGIAESNYAKWQEKTRKDVERGFGVLQRKFHFLVHKVELWDIKEIVSIVKCCILLHNWMVTYRLSHDEQESMDFYIDFPNNSAAANTAAADSATDDSAVADSAVINDAVVNSDIVDSDIVDSDVVDSDATVLNNAGSTNPQSNNSNQVGLNTRAHELYMQRRQELLTFRYNLVQERWKSLYDSSKFYRLQEAIINELATNGYTSDTPEEE